MQTPVTAPMPGEVLRLEVKPGDHVVEDDTVLVIESMKMEVDIVAPCDGLVKEFTIGPGVPVAESQVLAYIEV